MRTITTYRKSGRLFILRVMAIFQQLPLRSVVIEKNEPQETSRFRRVSEQTTPGKFDPLLWPERAQRCCVTIYRVAIQ